MCWLFFEFLHGVYPDVPQRHWGRAPDLDTPDISIPFCLLSSSPVLIFPTRFCFVDSSACPGLTISTLFSYGFFFLVCLICIYWYTYTIDILLNCLHNSRAPVKYKSQFCSDVIVRRIFASKFLLGPFTQFATQDLSRSTEGII